jgi:hypothetical protein
MKDPHFPFLRGHSATCQEDPKLPEPHLYELGQDREREAVKVSLEQHLLADPYLWQPLGITSYAAWFALEFKTSWLIGCTAELHAQCPGDIDVIAGPLKSSIPQSELTRLMASDTQLAALGETPYLRFGWLAENGLIEWPPSVDYLVAIEARACIWKQPGRPSNFQGRMNKYREKARGLISLGFDRVMLLHLITTEPNQVPDGNPFLVSLRESKEAADQLENNPFSSDQDTFGEAIWPLGSLKHKSEREAGTGTIRVIRQPSLAGAQTQRQKDVRSRIEKKLAEVFSKLAKPRFSPLFFSRRSTRGNRIKMTADLWQGTPAKRADQ